MIVQFYERYNESLITSVVLCPVEYLKRVPDTVHCKVQYHAWSIHFNQILY